MFLEQASNSKGGFHTQASLYGATVKTVDSMCVFQWWVLPGPSASCSFSDVGQWLGEPSPGYRLAGPQALKLSPELLQGHLQQRDACLVWVPAGGTHRRLLVVPLRTKPLRIKCGPPALVLEPSIKVPSGPGPWSRASTSTQQTLEDCSCSVFFVEGRIILISSMPRLLLKNIRPCEISV